MIPPDSFEHYLASLRLSVRPEETEAFVKFADSQFADSYGSLADKDWRMLG